MSLVERARSPQFRFLAVAGVVVAAVAAWLSLGRGGPDERRRAAHPAGFSIVVPRAWDAREDPPDAATLGRLLLRPVQFRGHSPWMLIAERRAPPDDVALPDSFQGRPARVLLTQKGRDRVWNAVVERGGRWFELTATLPGLEGARLEEYLAFLATFRAEAAPRDTATRPTTP